MFGRAVCMVLGVSIALGGCTPAEDIDNSMWPKAGRTADFSFIRELQTATAACIASEVSGPQELGSLQGKGFAPFSDIGVQGYLKQSAATAKGNGDDVGVVRVSDKGKFACSIEVLRNGGYTAMTTIALELNRQGYAMQKVGRTERYIGNGKRFSLAGRTSLYNAWARIDLRLENAASDRTCHDTSLPANLREGC